MRWALARAWYRLRHRFCRDIILEELTDALHPDFGYEWNEGGTGYEYIEAARHEGACSMLDSIRSSLRDYPYCGGDIEIMKAVEKIIEDDRNKR
jgi:hypothetical protein